MSSLLRKKIFLCYIIITAIVLFLTVVMVNERFRFRRFEGVINETNYARENIHKAHLYITRLATLGESVIAWDESDYNRYHYQRLKTDSILLEIKSGCGNFLRPVQIDSLRVLLETKETHLFRIMKAVQSWVESDSILANELPVIATQSVRMKTITQKKKGIAGLFGKKETVQVPYITNEIQDFNERLTSARDWRNNQMGAYADSLRLQLLGSVVFRHGKRDDTLWFLIYSPEGLLPFILMTGFPFSSSIRLSVASMVSENTGVLILMDMTLVSSP